MTERPNKYVATGPSALHVDNADAKGDAIDFRDQAEIAAALSEPTRQPDAIDRLVEASLAAMPHAAEGLIGHVEELIAGANSLEEVQEIMATVVGDMLAGMDIDRFTELLASASFSTKIAGMIERPGQ